MEAKLLHIMEYKHLSLERPIIAVFHSYTTTLLV